VTEKSYPATGHTPKAISTTPYASVGRKGKPVVQRERILEAIDLNAVPLTRRMIAETTGIPINVVCWRVQSLFSSGELHVAYRDVDPVTGERAEYLDRPPVQPEQPRLFKEL
jgi:hypothetical protein